MSPDQESAQADLAFLRQLAQPSDRWQASFGEAYAAAGAVYFLQLLGHLGPARGWLQLGDAGGLALGVAPTLVFLAILGAIILRHRGRASPGGGVAGRTVGSVFGVVGLSNLVLIAVIGLTAVREHSLTTWLIYPCTVYVLQGAAWLTAGAVRRRGWMMLVGAGWFADALWMALEIGRPGMIVAAGAGMLALMVVPGLVMVRLAGRAERSA